MYILNVHFICMHPDCLSIYIHDAKLPSAFSHQMFHFVCAQIEMVEAESQFADQEHKVLLKRQTKFAMYICTHAIGFVVGPF